MPDDLDIDDFNVSYQAGYVRFYDTHITRCKSCSCCPSRYFLVHASSFSYSLAIPFCMSQMQDIMKLSIGVDFGQLPMFVRAILYKVFISVPTFFEFNCILRLFFRYVLSFCFGCRYSSFQFPPLIDNIYNSVCKSCYQRRVMAFDHEAWGRSVKR